MLSIFFASRAVAPSHSSHSSAKSRVRSCAAAKAAARAIHTAVVRSQYASAGLPFAR
jgi:hypothetical protein